MKALTFAGDGSGRVTEGDIPAAIADRANKAREELIEMVAEADETLIEKFFDAGTLTQEELASGLRNGTQAGKIFPALCASGGHVIGMQPVLDAIATLVPSPAERDLPAVDSAGAEIAVKASDSAPYAAFVWKTIADPFAGRITMLRVIAGTLKQDSNAHNQTRDSAERFGHLLVLQGKTQTQVPELKAGDLGAVAKLKDTRTNDVLAEKTTRIKLAEI